MCQTIHGLSFNNQEVNRSGLVISGAFDASRAATNTVIMIDSLSKEKVLTQERELISMTDRMVRQGCIG